MRESVSDQRILADGRALGRVEAYAELKVVGYLHVLLLGGLRKYGPVSRAALARLATIDDPNRLGDPFFRLPEVSGWDELLDV